MKIIWYRSSIQTLWFQACLPTRQNGVKNRDQAYCPPRSHFWLVNPSAGIKTTTQFFGVQLDWSRRFLLPQKEHLLRFRQSPERLAARFFCRARELVTCGSQLELFSIFKLIILENVEWIFLLREVSLYILRWKLENVAGSYSPFFLRTFIKKKKLTKGDQARTKVGFQLFYYSSH